MNRGQVFEIEVRFEPRADGGMRAYSPDVPLFVLSHREPESVIENVIPALECMLSHQLKGTVSVEKLSRFGHDSEIGAPTNGIARYASRVAAECR